MEIWKDIIGFDGLYKVSNYGRVMSYHGSGRILRPRYDKRGYVQYILYKNGTKTSVKGHHLVWDLFGDGKRNGRIINVDHIDEDRSNNNISNLQLLSNRENLSKGKNKQRKSSDYTGVYKPKQYNKYQAYITINGKHKYLGAFESQEEASLAYQTALKSIK